MKKILLIFIASWLLLTGFAQIGKLVDDSQEINSGTIRYEAVDKFDLSFFEGSDSKTKDWLASMPKGIKLNKVLYFDDEYSLYEEDANSTQGESDEKTQTMIYKMDYISGPNPKTIKIFLDQSNGTKTEQLEFMGRNFIINSNQNQWNWRPEADQVLILGYICMSASTTIGDKKAKAWFAPDIQTWTGPDNYRGLPGLILAVDIDGENVLLATSVVLGNSEEQKIIKPNNGKLISTSDFGKLYDQKIKEYEEMIKSKGTAKGDAAKKY